MSFSSTLPIFLVGLASLFSGSSSAPLSFSVDKYGAKGDGTTDSTKAFVAAWQAMCGASGPAEMYVPNGNFLVLPTTFAGKCACPAPTVRMDGTLLGPLDYMVISKAGRWINFDKVENLVIQGGTLRCRAKYLTDCKTTKQNDPKCPMGGRSLVISGSRRVRVVKLTVDHSQGFNIAIRESQDVTLDGVTITAPADSKNTDGIHVQNGNGVHILGANIGTGDDCISLGPGSQNVLIQNVQCGPGHGVSIGSLGADQGEAPVTNVTARDVHFKGSTNGFRIKSWAKPNAMTVNDIHFLNGIMDDVMNPIIVDQNYCPGGGCPNTQPSLVRITNVEFSNISGTSATPVAITLNCSAKVPCTGVTLNNIKLTGKGAPAKSDIKNAVIKTIGVVEPPCAGGK